MKVREIIKLIKDDGWYLDKHKATSHRQFKHPSKPGKVTVAGNLGKELKKGTEHSIIKQAGIQLH